MRSDGERCPGAGEGPGRRAVTAGDREKATASGASLSAPDWTRTSDLRFRRPRREFGGARLSSGFGSVAGVEFAWVRLDSVPSVALLLPSLASRASGSPVVFARPGLPPLVVGITRR
jgi:hypothetical protein